MENKCKEAKWLSEEALQIAVKRREAKSKGEKERYIHLLLDSLIFTAICMAYSDKYFAFFAFIILGDVLALCPLYNVMNLCP